MSAVSTVAKPVMRGMHVNQIKGILIKATIVSRSVLRECDGKLECFVSVLHPHLHCLVHAGQQAQEGGLQELLC